MARRRTRKDKIIAQLRRQVSPSKETDNSSSNSEEITYNFEKIPQEIKSPDRSEENEDKASLFSYDPSLIRKDLLKTAIFAAIAFSIEIFLYFFLK